jgi:hypothetical protein
LGKKPETKFKEKVVARLREEFGPDIWFYKTQQVALGGIPDIVGCLKGRLFAWELKSSNRSASPLQLHILDQIHFSGGLAVTVHPDNFEESLLQLKRWVQSPND